MKLIKKGATCRHLVKVVQRALGLKDDGIFGQQTEAAVKDFQRLHGLIDDGIVGSQTLKKLLGLNFALCGSVREITEVIVHCAATPEGKPFTVDDVRRWHRQKGWTDVGYHYVIGLRGELWMGRDVDIQGAHCAAGGHNRKSIGVCYIGGVARDGKTPKDTRTPEQKATLLKLLMDLRKLYPGMRIYGHHDFERGKACPSFDAKNEYRTI
jgi:N-acetylmuramoyl-L-alanine amidase